MHTLNRAFASLIPGFVPSRNIVPSLRCDQSSCQPSPKPEVTKAQNVAKTPNPFSMHDAKLSLQASRWGWDSQTLSQITAARKMSDLHTGFQPTYPEKGNPALQRSNRNVIRDGTQWFSMFYRQGMEARKVTTCREENEVNSPRKERRGWDGFPLLVFFIFLLCPSSLQWDRAG